jgi:hypothetical protein
MAEVYEILELVRQVSDIISRTNALDKKLSALYNTQETMFKQGETTATIKTAMNAVLDDCDAIAAQIATDLDAIPMTVWAEEYRIDNPLTLHHWDIDLSGSPKTIRAEQGDGTASGTFIATPADGDRYELVNPEDPENANTEFQLSGGGHSTSIINSTTGLVGGVSNSSDTKAKIILRQR